MARWDLAWFLLGAGSVLLVASAMGSWTNLLTTGHSMGFGTIWFLFPVLVLLLFLFDRPARDDRA